MYNIASHIEFMLRTNDCVIVPGFGAFVIQHVPACYVADSHTFFPPKKQVYFNSDLTHNDGMLASSIARRDAIPYQQACALMESEVAAIKNTLMSNRKVSLGSLGTVRLSDNDLKIFEAGSEAVLAPALYGLSPITLTTVEEREAYSSATNNRPRLLTFDTAWKVAASVIVLVLIGFLTTTPIVVDKDIHYASLALPEITSPVNEMPHQSVEIQLNIAEPADSTDATTIITPVELARINASRRFNDSDPYYLVVASLANMQQARQFMNLHPDVYLEPLEHNSKIRIIATTGQSADMVMRLTHDPDFATLFPDAWPCHR